ncbi:MAG: SAM-dependent chlorinase/fluorinase [Betaproteobacteria bacterium]|nr:SAM-dependent chlorinase/fluorinase [Betaproteobacteria bacterium]
MIVLYTDFGATDIYVGQLKSVLAQLAPNVPVVDLAHDLVPFEVVPAAHLLHGLAARFPAGTVFCCVVDPGVGGKRGAAVLEADGRWYVGPDNGLLSVVGARAARRRSFRIDWRPAQLSVSFHGRDLFAPMCAWLAAGPFPADKLVPTAELDVELGAADSPTIIYIDHYGNAMTGLRARSIDRGAGWDLEVGGRRIGHAGVFSEVPPGALFWYENSLGLVEVAARQASACERLGLAVGMPVRAGEPRDDHGR